MGFLGVSSMDYADLLERAVFDVRKNFRFTPECERQYREVYTHWLIQQHLGVPHDIRLGAYREKLVAHVTSDNPVDAHLLGLELPIHEQLLEIRGDDSEFVGV